MLNKICLATRPYRAAYRKMYKIECDIIFCYYIINFFLNTTIFIIKISTWYHRICLSAQCDRQDSLFDSQNQDTIRLHTGRSVREPGARTNWFNLPRRDLMKVCDSVISISPVLLISNLAQVLGKNSPMYDSILASDTYLVTRRISAAAF